MEKTKYRKARGIDVFQYSFGGLGSNLAFVLTMLYLTFFYTDIFGISSMAVAGLMLVSRLIDAVTDPVMGMIGDHTRSKMGRFRPWIVFGAPFLGLTIFLLFSSPNLSPTMKVVYAYVVYITYSLASTVVNIPYHSLMSVISDDPNQRTVMQSCNGAMSTVAQIIVGTLALPLVKVFGGGARGWQIYGAVIGILTTVSFWVCANGSKRYDKILPDAPKTKFNLKDNVHILLGNKPLIMLMIAFGTDVLAGASQSAVNMYYMKYVLHREDLVPIMSLLTMGIGFLALPVIPAVCEKFGKKQVYWMGSALCIIPLVVLWLIPTPTVTILMSMLGILGFLTRFPGNLGWAMLPECIDFAEWKYGVRGAGIISSSLTFINKVGAALGGALASFLLAVVNFVPNQEQTPTVCSMILFLRFGLPILGYIASLISMWFYEITNEKYAQIRQDLSDRSTQNTAK